MRLDFRTRYSLVFVTSLPILAKLISEPTLGIRPSSLAWGGIVASVSSLSLVFANVG